MSVDGDILFTQTLVHRGGLRSTARIRDLPPVELDEPESLGGHDEAPSPMDYLLSATGGCLLASLTHCLGKKRVEAEVTVEMSGIVARDEEKLLRVTSMTARFTVATASENRVKVEGCWAIFKKYCIVGSSVARGIPLETVLVFREG